MAKTYKQIMDEARQLVPEVSADDVKALDRGEKPVLLDVREKEEFRQGTSRALSRSRAASSRCGSRRRSPTSTRRSSPTAPAARARCSPAAC